MEKTTTSQRQKQLTSEMDAAMETIDKTLEMISPFTAGYGGTPKMAAPVLTLPSLPSKADPAS